MHFDTRYSIGDTVWMPHSNIQYVSVGDCPVCKGTGVSPFNENVFCTAKADLWHTCRKGKLCAWKNSWQPCEYKIAHISAEFDEDGTYEEEYWVEDYDGLTYSPNEFFTLEECKEECKKRNEERPYEY